MKYLKITLLSLLGILSLSVMAAEKPLIFTSFGGAYGGSQQKHFVDYYIKKTGNPVLMANYSGGVAEISAQVKAKNIKWDVVDIEYVDLDRACDDGLLETLPMNKLPKGDNGVAAKDDFVKGSLNDCAVPVMIWSIIFATRSDKGASPKSINDVFNIKKYPGKRALRKRPQVNLEWALIADGVPRADVYKVLATKKGQDRAFKKLATISKNIVWFDSWSQAPQLLNDGGVVVVQSANGRIYDSIKKDKSPFNINWDAHSFDYDGLAILKGTKNFDRAWDFIKEVTKSKPLAGLQEVAYAPTRQSSAPYIDKSIENDLPLAHLKQGVKMNGTFWSDYGSSLEERFNSWLLKQK